MEKPEPAQILRSIGMQPKYKGYLYILFMLNITRSRPELVYQLSKTLYPLVMENFSVSKTSVARSVQFAISKTWEQGNKKELMALFRVYGISWIPSNREFLAVITERTVNSGKSEPVQLWMFAQSVGK